jgi:hypothetical protein
MKNRIQNILFNVLGIVIIILFFAKVFVHNYYESIGDQHLDYISLKDFSKSYFPIITSYEELYKKFGKPNHVFNQNIYYPCRNRHSEKKPIKIYYWKDFTYVDFKDTCYLTSIYFIENNYVLATNKMNFSNKTNIFQVMLKFPKSIDDKYFFSKNIMIFHTDYVKKQLLGIPINTENSTMNLFFSKGRLLFIDFYYECF